MSSGAYGNTRTSDSALNAATMSGLTPLPCSSPAAARRQLRRRRDGFGARIAQVSYWVPFAPSP